MTSIDRDLGSAKGVCTAMCIAVLGKGCKATCRTLLSIFFAGVRVELVPRETRTDTTQGDADSCVSLAV